MVVCRYWRQGNCRNGSNCRFDHPNDNGNGNGNSGNNRQSNFGGGGAFGNSSRPEKWSLNEEDIKNDLTEGRGRPKWILSGYGPGKETPAALFIDNEYSAEEVRWRFTQAQATGNAEVANQEAISIWQKAENDMKNAAANVRNIQNFMDQKEKEYPNRYDFCKMDGTISKEKFAENSRPNSDAKSSTNPFGGAASSTNPFSKPAFGAPSPAFGQPSSTFGKPVQAGGFGQASFGQTGFGQTAQPSAFGKPAFGQASFGQAAFNQPKSAFGQPLGQSSTFGGKAAESASKFGQPAVFGQNNSSNPFSKPSASAFGGGSSRTAVSGFGQTAFGQTAAPANNASPFGQNLSVPNSQSSFGQVSQLPTSSPFGSTPNPGTGSSGFGGGGGAGPSPFSGNKQSAPTFGHAGSGQNTQPQTTPAFGQPLQSQQQPAFGQSTFGQATQRPSFGQTQFGQKTQAQTLFGQPSQVLQSTTQEGRSLSPSDQNDAPFGSGMFAKASISGVPNPPSGIFGHNNSTQPAQVHLNPTANEAVLAATNDQSAVSQTTAAVHVAQSSASKLSSKPIQPLHYTQALASSAPPQFGADGKLTSFKGMPVQYDIKLKPTAAGEEVIDQELPVYQRPDRKGLERIWFARGAAETAVQNLAKAILDFQLPENDYTGEINEEYKRLFENGRFDHGRVPLVPPMRGWVDYDF